MYAICKVRYSDPQSWRYGTLDAVVLSTDKRSPGMVLYSLVYRSGIFSEAHIYPCRFEREQVPSLKDLKENLQSGAEGLDEATMSICAERLGWDKMVDTVIEDFGDAPDSLDVMMDVIRQCFGGGLKAKRSR